MAFPQLGPVLVVFLLGELSLHYSLSHSLSKRQVTNCYTRCPDPKKAWNNPCGTCDHSQCKYEGCVYYGAFYVYWMPDPCTKCFCENGKKNCYRTQCASELDCYGYPKVRRSGKCCEECDFGVSDSACGLIPVSSIRHNGTDTRGTCSKVVVHGCNKHYIFIDKLDFTYTDDKWYECINQPGYSRARDSPGCGHMRGKYRDTTSCVQREIDSRDMPMDYDSNPICSPLPPE